MLDPSWFSIVVATISVAFMLQISKLWKIADKCSYNCNQCSCHRPQKPQYCSHKCGCKLEYKTWIYLNLMCTFQQLKNETCTNQNQQKIWLNLINLLI